MTLGCRMNHILTMVISLVIHFQSDSFDDTQRRIAKLHWQSGIVARDENHAPIKATHHFLLAAQAAAAAGDSESSRSYQIAAAAGQFGEDRFLNRPVRDVKFSSDSKYWLTWASDTHVYLWQRGHTAPIATLKHGAAIDLAQFTRTGRRVLTADGEGTINVWDVSKIRSAVKLSPLFTIKHQAKLNGWKLFDNDQKLLTWSDDSTAIVWDIQNKGRPIQTFTHQGSVLDAAVDLPTNQILTTDDNFTAKLWRSDDGTLVHQFKHQPSDSLDAWLSSNLTNPKFLDGGRRVSISTPEGVEIWDPKSGQRLEQHFRHDRRYTGQSFPAFIGTNADGVFFYDTPDGKATRRLAHGLATGVEPGIKITAIDYQRREFLTTINTPFYGYAHNGWAQLWTFDSLQPIQTYHHRGVINDAQFSHDHRTVVTMGMDRHAILWDREQRSQKRIIRHRRPVVGARFSPDDRLLVTWTDQNVARLTHLAPANPSKVVGVFKSEFPGNFRWVATAKGSVSAVTWDPYEKFIFQRFLSPDIPERKFQMEANVDHVLVSGDGKYLFAMDRNRRGRLWNLSNGDLIRKFSQIEGLRFSPDRRQAVYWNHHHAGALDLRSPKIVHSSYQIHPSKSGVENEPKKIVDAVFSDTGVLVFATRKNQIHVIPTNDEQGKRIFLHGSHVDRVITGPQGKAMITTGIGDSGTRGSYLWSLSQDEPVADLRLNFDSGLIAFSFDETKCLVGVNATQHPTLYEVKTGTVVQQFDCFDSISEIGFINGSPRIWFTTHGRTFGIFAYSHQRPLITIDHKSTHLHPIFLQQGRSVLVKEQSEILRWRIERHNDKTIQQQIAEFSHRTHSRLNDSGDLVANKATSAAEQ